MKKTFVLYNPYANNGKGEEIFNHKVINQLENATYIDVTKISNYTIFFDDLATCDDIIICGGDGTLNYFINNTRGMTIKNKIYFCPAGTGNDFYRDICGKIEDKMILINDYLDNLPIAKIKGKEYLFINGIGFGIDGYCCEVGDKMRATSDKPINYTAIAIKGLLFNYKRTNATIIVDGKTYHFKNVWLAPTMKGRTYGGGMIAAPDQDRKGNLLSVMVFRGKSKLKTLMIFPSIFKGEHIKKRKNVYILTGKDIKVTFDSPRPLQVDGETILDVLEYEASI